MTAGIARNQPIKRLGNLEKEAEALVESIRKDERGRVIRHGSSRHSLNSSQYDTPGSAMGGGASFEEDEGSIGGDMARLTRSISMIQRDLEMSTFPILMMSTKMDLKGWAAWTITMAMAVYWQG